ncbi:MAG TPA: M23 family metallopeptidase, partial [Candidatus Caenarcaniphilales bacterium]
MTQKVRFPAIFSIKVIPMVFLMQGLGLLVGFPAFNAAQALAQGDVIDASPMVSAEPAAPPVVSAEPVAPPITVVEPEPSPVAPPPSIPAPAAAASRVGSTDEANAYIDSTDYSIGATKSQPVPTALENTQPSPVVLSERSTGCQTVLQAGQGVPGSLCGATAKSRTLQRSQAGGVATRIRPMNRQSFTSRANYAGAGFRPSATGIVPVKMNSLRLSGRGISLANPTAGLRTYPPFRRGLLSGNAQLTFPLAIPAAITSVFGWRNHPITGQQRFHAGTDLGAPLGTPVLAAQAGKVAIAEFQGGYGLSIVLKHQQETRETRYAHLSEVLVQPGQWVDQGSVIGRVGSTGNSTGPHLHFELWQSTPQGWVVTDPGGQLEYALAHL